MPDSLKVYKTNTVVKGGPHVLPITPTQDAQDKTKYTFKMPSYPVRVTAEFEEKAITIADIIATYENFPLTKDEDLYWTNKQGTTCYYFNNNLFFRYTSTKSLMQSMTVSVAADGKNYTYSDGTVTYTFIMDDSGVLAAITVSGSTDEKYNGTYGAPPTKHTVTNGTTDINGDIAIDKTTAAESETVTVTVNPAEGYQLKTLKYNDGTTDYDITKDATTGDYLFTMPGYAVTVTAEFEEVPAHTHAFTYAANNGKITATCTQGCDKGYDTTPLTLTLTAPSSLVYDGNAKVFTFADGEAAAWTGAGLELPTITYYQKYSGQGWYTQLNEVPVNAGGDYMAEIVVNNKAAQVKFTIDKATPYIKTNPEPTDIIYGKKLADSTLAGGYVQISSSNTTQVGGLFEWTNSDTVPDLDDSEVTEYDVTFTPADTDNFNSVSCKVKIKVNHTHAPVLVNGQAATESAAGWKDYYECACGALFEDENGTTPIENLATWKAEGGNGYIPPLAPESYTVTFNMNGHGTQIDPQTVKAGSKATKPAVDPTAEGWTFDGWYADATFNVTFDFDAAINANTTVYAKWTENPGPQPYAYTIVVGAGSEWTKGGSTGLIITSDAPFAKFNSVEVDGNTIAATNYAAEEGSTKITLAPAYLETLSVGTHSIKIVSNDGSASTNFTIKAAVPPVPTSYTVTFNMNGHGTQVTAQTVESGSKAIKPADPKASGYTFGGWYADATFSAKFDFNTAITTNTTVYAKWTKNSAAPTDPTSPQTGDNSHMFLWVALLLVSGVTLVGTTVYGKKRSGKRCK